MKYTSLGLTVLLVAFAGSALAQNQVSGTLKCDNKKSTPYTVEVGDHPGHILIIGKDKGDQCSWPVPIEIAGVKATGNSGAGFTDVDGAKFQDRGYGVLIMENGDKIFSRNQDTGTVTDKEGKAVAYEGTWSFTGGTGKFKGIRGKGTYKGSGDPNGEETTTIEGEYTLPAAGATGK